MASKEFFEGDKGNYNVALQDDKNYRDPGTGESPLGDNYFEGLKKKLGQTAGGSTEYQQFYAGQDFKSIFGRNPTPSELAMLASSYAGDKNLTNSSVGKSTVAQYFQSFSNSPENIAKRKKDQYLKDAPQHYGAIDQIFKTSIGRSATEEEKAHFGSLLASNDLDAYQLGQFVNQLPESVQKQDKAFRESLTGDLQKQDQQYFSEQVMPSIQSAFANQGRDIRSSGFSNSLAQAANQQNRQRESFLSNLTAQQYSGNQAGARSDYESSVARMYGLQDYSRQRSDQMMDVSNNRIKEIQDYNLQKQAYDEYLKRYGKRGGGSAGIAQGALSGAASGATAGAAAGPWGALAGGIVGAGLGGYAGSRG